MFDSRLVVSNDTSCRIIASVAAEIRADSIKDAFIAFCAIDYHGGRGASSARDRALRSTEPMSAAGPSQGAHRSLSGRRAAQGAPMSPKRMRLEEQGGRVGQEIGVSPWLVVDQARIDRFAERDRRHAVDPRRSGACARRAVRRDDRARLPHAVAAVASLRIDVLVRGAQLRHQLRLEQGSLHRAASRGLARAREVRPRASRRPSRAAAWEHAWNVAVEREGADKPVLVAEWLVRNH